MKLRKALVTGGCGFVGRHLVRELINDQYDVTVVDDLSGGLHPALWPRFLSPAEDFCFCRTDVRDFFQSCTESFDLIVHLAAVVGGRMIIEGNSLRVATNLAIDAMFFDWLTKLKPPPGKTVFFSSSAAYPVSFQTRANHCRLSEDMIDFKNPIGIPDMTYGWAKLTGELLAQYAVEKYGLDVVIYRPFSGYGEDQDIAYPFPSIVDRVVRKEPRITVWGSGKQIRDFIHVDDIVQAVMVTKDQLDAGVSLNLGSGTGTSFLQLAELCLKVTGYQAQIGNDTSQPEGVFARVGDNTCLSKLYRCRISLEEGIERAVNHLSKKEVA
jgi:nucleoside-diphosphate-sugar epimerase